MENSQITDNVLFEHRFWLQIMGDHSRFIFFSLAPTESIYIQKAQDFIILFDQLLEESRKELSHIEIKELHRKAYDLTYQLRIFKLELLALTLTSEIKVHLSSTFFNDMLNELDEYLFVISLLMKEDSTMLHPIHYHMLWLTDAIGHAASITAELDLVEKDMIAKSQRFEMVFRDLNLKSLLMNGYLRTQISRFPSMDRFNEQAGIAILEFKDFLEYIREQRIDGKLLGTLLPLMADHMAREECYYLWKLSLVTQTTRRPDCDPTSPRLEI